MSGKDKKYEHGHKIRDNDDSRKPLNEEQVRKGPPENTDNYKGIRKDGEIKKKED